VIVFTLNRGRITAIDLIRNPEKLNTLSDTRINTAKTPRASDSRSHGGVTNRAK
jgi:hypothetical protein